MQAMNRWIEASRPRTLPMSCSAVALGAGLGAFESSMVPVWLLIIQSALIVATAALLQILSNFANDLGDMISGVDRVERAGRVSVIGQGKVSLSEMKKATFAVLAVTLVVGSLALLTCFWGEPAKFGWFCVLGACSAIAAVTYTMGPSYSYIGLGDLFVFVFFGLVAVMGAEFMLAGHVSIWGVLWGCMAGFSSTMTLNVNNLRDYESDLAVGRKKSVPVRFGVKAGKIYHAAMFASAGFIYLFSVLFLYSPLWLTLALAAAVPFAKTACEVVSPKSSGSMLEPLMKPTSVGAALLNMSLLAGVLFA